MSTRGEKLSSSFFSRRVHLAASWDRARAAWYTDQLAREEAIKIVWPEQTLFAVPRTRQDAPSTKNAFGSSRNLRYILGGEKGIGEKGIAR